MNYFKILGIVFGLAAMLKPFYIPEIDGLMLEKDNGKKIVVVDILAEFSG
ncbi:MAG: hypothetical protein AWU59_1292 [Methanolobus sp. T82-4]|nr:MAG: hypothetical protein AWU59_1292 [Methanolobus sp. T82-4]